MKSITRYSLHVVGSDSTPRQEPTSAFQSPYLKAILSGAARAINACTMIKMIDDRAAASRYIKQSGFLRG